MLGKEPKNLKVRKIIVKEECERSPNNREIELQCTIKWSMVGDQYWLF